MFIMAYEGMEALAISVVVMGYTRLIHDMILGLPKVRELIKKIPGPQFVKDRTPWLVAGYTVDGFALFLIYLLY